MAMDDFVTIASGGLSAAINPLGAELSVLRDGEGRDLLWDGDPAFWTGRAPILFPIVGALVDDGYTLDGQRYHLPRHGFARRRRFALADHQPDSATFRLDADDDTRAAYPFDFRLDMRFALSAAAIEMAATVTNRGDTPMPASFGFHPALRWPLPYGRPRTDHRITFAAPEPGDIRRIDAAGLLLPDPRPTPVAGNVLHLTDDLFAEDAVILDTPASRSLTYGAPDGPKIAVDFPAMPQLGIWTKAGAGYICIEPWQGIADPAGFAGDLRDKPGMVIIAPAASRDFTMHIALQQD